MVSTLDSGHYQGMIQKQEHTQKLKKHMLGISPFYIKNTLNLALGPKSTVNAVRLHSLCNITKAKF